MTDRESAWFWLAAAAVWCLIEWAVYTWWNEWFFLIRGGHWAAVAVSAYYFGRHRGTSLGRSAGCDS